MRKATKATGGKSERNGWKRINLRLDNPTWEELLKVSERHNCTMTEALRTVTIWGLETAKVATT